MIRSFLNIYSADIGVQADNILVTLLGLPPSRYPGAEAQISFYDRLKMRLEAIPGVESVAVAESIPTWGSRQVPYELAGDEPSAVQQGDQQRPRVSALVISPDYFRTLGAAVLSGRAFDTFDGASGVPVVIVNQRFANAYWAGQNPLGKRVRLFHGKAREDWLTVVGVASNIVQNDAIRQEFDPVVYLPYQQRPAGTMWVIARTRVPPDGLRKAFQREIRAMDPDLPMSLGAIPLAKQLASSYQYRATSGVLFGIFAAIALLLAAVGLYAVIAHSVSQRTQEIGIRMAIGATGSDIRKLILMQGMVPLGIGLAIGLAASFGVNRVLRAQLVHVSPADPGTYLAASAVLILSAIVGCWIPVRRATRVDPVVALRHE
jgi:putative ABC transport system permease protein